MLNYRYCETLSIIEKSVLHRPTWSQSRKQPRQNHLSFPTNADLPDNLPTRWHPTTTPISENSSANGCSRNFELFSFFRVLIKKNFGGHVPPPRTPMFVMSHHWLALDCRLYRSLHPRSKHRRWSLSSWLTISWQMIDKRCDVVQKRCVKYM